MRKTMLSGCLVAALCFASGCGSENRSTDAVETAEKVNEEKAEAKEDAAEANAGAQADATGDVQVKATDSDKFEDDADFAVKAANGGMLEVELATLASTKATSQEVKMFAKHMLSDHTKANKELKALASQKNITLPATLGEDAKKEMDRLSQLSGKEFDEEYIDFMVEDHEEDVELFRQASKEATDPGIKAFAAKTLPTLEGHLQMAKQSKEKVDDKEDNASAKGH